MKILITGGLGYLGGRLSSYLKSKNHHVTITSRKSLKELSADSTQFFDSILRLKNSDDHWIGDISFNGFDTVIHLAALNENDCVKFPYKAIEVNISDTLRILNQSIEDGVKNFLYLSTFHVYGSGLNTEISENTLCRPTHPYSITHKAAEDFVLAARSKNEINANCIRLSNVFGYPANTEVNRWTLLVNDLCKQVIENKRMVLNSSGEQKRDFLTMEDFCQASEIVLNTEKQNLYNGIINVGSGVSLTVLEMAIQIKNICEKNLSFKPELIVGSGGENNAQMKFNTVRLKSLGFIPRNNNEIEILGTLNYFLKNKSA